MPAGWRWLRRELLAAAVWTILSPPLVAGGQGNGTLTELQVRQLRVDPAVVQSGETVSVEATVVNMGERVVHGLRIGIAVSGSDGRTTHWRPLQRQPAEPVELGPGEQIHFLGTAELYGDEWLQVGLAGVAAEGILAPRGVRIRVVQLQSSVVEVGLVFVSFVSLVGLLVGAAALALRVPGRGRRLSPHRGLIGGGLVILLAGPALLWSARQRLVSQAGGTAVAPTWALVWLPLGGVALFALGWLIVATGLRPGGSSLRGLFLGSVAYVVVGLAWVVAFNVSLGRHVLALVHPATFPLALVWPLQVAQAFGWFGLSID